MLEYNSIFENVMVKRLITVFTWLNAAGTISYLANFNAATIQGRPLIKGAQSLQYLQTHNLLVMPSLCSCITALGLQIHKFVDSTVCAYNYYLCVIAS